VARKTHPHLAQRWQTGKMKLKTYLHVSNSKFIQKAFKLRPETYVQAFSIGIAFHIGHLGNNAGRDARIQMSKRQEKGAR
jgi:hypothetical protein